MLVSSMIEVGMGGGYSTCHSFLRRIIARWQAVFEAA